MLTSAIGPLSHFYAVLAQNSPGVHFYFSNNSFDPIRRAPTTTAATW